MRFRARLGETEQVIIQTHPAAAAMVGPAIWLVVLSGLFGASWAVLPSGWQPWGQVGLIAVAVIALLGLVIVPFSRWIATVFTITNRRVLLSVGVFSRSDFDVSLSHVQEIGHRRSLANRLSGAGTLLLTTTSGEVVTVAHLPQVERLHGLLSELVWASGPSARLG